MTRDQCVQLDEQDALRTYREEFDLQQGLIYLDGNSLGPLPHRVRKRVADVVEAQWGKSLIRGWNEGWIDLPRQVGEKIAPLIGAGPGQVICCDSVSVNVFKLLAAALQLRPGRSVIVSEQNNFPTDLYMAQGLAGLLGEGRCQLREVTTDTLADNLDESTAVLMLTPVNFRTGECHDMAPLVQAAHKAGALVLLDLSHSAGAMPVVLDAANIDMAVGCGYKYLNGGPGAPAFVYLAQRHHERVRQPLQGWMGHQSPFEFETGYAAGPGVSQFLAGTPAILSMSALDAALDIWQDIDMQAVREKSLALSQCFITLAASAPALASLTLVSPAEPSARGSQVCFSHPMGYAMVQALIRREVLADFRAPNILRFGLAPLYTRFVDIWDAVDALRDIVGSGEYLKPTYLQSAHLQSQHQQSKHQQRNTVT